MSISIVDYGPGQAGPAGSVGADGGGREQNPNTAVDWSTGPGHAPGRLLCYGAVTDPTTTSPDPTSTFSEVRTSTAPSS